jgi:hypothetical protein
MKKLSDVRKCILLMSSETDCNNRFEQLFSSMTDIKSRHTTGLADENLGGMAVNYT